MFSVFQVFLASLVALYASESELDPASSWPQALLKTALFLLIPFIWAFALRWLGPRFRDRTWVRFLALTFPFSPIITFTMIAFWAPWPVVVEKLPLGNSDFLEFFALLAPFLFSQLCLWVIRYRVERPVGLSSVDYVFAQSKLLLFALLPLSVFFLGSDLLNAFPATKLLLETLSVANVAVTVLFVLFLLFLIPLSARFLWNTSPLPQGEMRGRLEEIAKRAQFRCREILLWKTPGFSVNAAILGLFPRFRYVILTDGLLESLQPTETEAVFGHELGHAKRHHVAIFFLMAVDAALLLSCIGEFLPQTELALLLLFLPAAGLFWLWFGYFSRRVELEADLYGAVLCGGVEPMIQALEKVGALSGRGRWHGSWRHFPISIRVDFLEKVRLNPELGKKLVRKLHRFSLLAVWLFLPLCLCYGFFLWNKFPSELAQFQRELAIQEKNSSAAPVQRPPTNLLDRVVFVGASLSDGFGNNLPLSTLFEKAIRISHEPPGRFTNSMLFLNPGPEATRQIQEALRLQPSLLIGVDFLFWFGYGNVTELSKRSPGERTESESAIEQRLEKLEEGLALLDQFLGPMVVGDFPDMWGADPNMLSPRSIPSPEALNRLNGRLLLWAEKRANVLVLPLAQWTREMQTEGFSLVDDTEEGKSVVFTAKELLQEDRLHPTELGVIAVCSRICTTLSDWIGPRASSLLQFDTKAVMEEMGVLDK